MKQKMTNGENPMTFKKLLAFELTKQLNSEAAATAAQQAFETRFQKRNVSQVQLPLAKLTSLKTAATIVDALVAFGMTRSKSEAKRLVEQRAVKINGTEVTAYNEAVVLKPNDVVEVGRKAVKIEK
jgi:tyrosyl-tRNA synthetase